MEAIKTPAGRFIVGLTPEETQGRMPDTEGMCTRCGEFADGVEPDGEYYECENCGAKSVFGIEQCVVYGFFKIVLKEK